MTSTTAPMSPVAGPTDVLKAIRQFFEHQILVETQSQDSATSEHGQRLATAALLIEMSRADFKVSEQEYEAVIQAVRRVFGLDPSQTQELVALAEKEADQATSLYQFTALINDCFSPAQKAHVVELLWEVAYADGRLDKYEEHLVRKIADLIHVPHREFIQAKHRVQRLVEL